jgi:di/tricarboxylate transporter
MTEMITVFSILAITIALFLSERLRLDLVALIALVLLLLFGILTVEEALAGFSAPIVLILAGLFVVGAGLVHTGVASSLGGWLGRTAGTSEVRITVLLMLLVAVLSAFLSSTGAVAIMLPVVISLARNAELSPSRLLMPLVLGALIGGMLTLIGTPPNILVCGLLVESGLEPFGFFEFTPIGLLILLFSIGYVILVGRRLLPSAPKLREFGDADGPMEDAVSTEQLREQYRLKESLFRLRVRRSSPLAGQQVREADLGARYGVNLLERQAWPDEEKPPLAPGAVTPATVLEANDVLLCQGTPGDIARLSREMDLGVRPRDDSTLRTPPTELGVAEVLIRGRSTLRGHTLKDRRFRNTYGVSVLGILRRGETIDGDFASTPLEFGDTLLVQGTWEQIRRLIRERADFIVTEVPHELTAQAGLRARAGWAIVITGLMLLLMTLQLLPTVTTALLAALAMVLTGCLPVREVYRSINWESLVLIAAMLPMATALKKTGGITFVARLLTDGLGSRGPVVVMGGLFLITTLFTQFISNTATTVLIAPIALAAAVTMNVSPHPFLMIVAIAASTAFSTPIASPVNTLILGPSGYRFRDFARVGVPLQILVLLLCLVAIPFFFPL